MFVWSLGDGVQLRPLTGEVLIDGRTSRLTLDRSLRRRAEPMPPATLQGEEGLRRAAFIRNLEDTEDALVDQRTLRLAGPDPFGRELHLDLDGCGLFVLREAAYGFSPLRVLVPRGDIETIGLLGPDETDRVSAEPAFFWTDLVPEILARTNRNLVPGPENCGIVAVPAEMLKRLERGVTDLLIALGVGFGALADSLDRLSHLDGWHRVKVTSDAQFVYGAPWIGEPDVTEPVDTRIDALARRLGVVGAPLRKIPGPSSFTPDSYRGRYEVFVDAATLETVSGQERVAARQRMRDDGFGDLLA
jgi:hypothetical protein